MNPETETTARQAEGEGKTAGAVPTRNVLSTAEWLEVAAAATTIFERLHAVEVMPAVGEGDSRQGGTRVEQWRTLLASRVPADFDKRLDWEGIEPTLLHARLGRAEWRPERALPSWVTTLDRVLRRCDAAFGPNPTSRALPRFLDHGEMPFWQILSPLVESASAITGDEFDACHISSLAGLEKMLFTELFRHCGRALELEFTVFRSQRRSGLGRLLDQVAETSETALYNAFVRRMAGGGLKAFLREYAVLARLVGTVIELWQQAVIEFGDRLGQNRDAIAGVFNGGRDPGPVIAVKGDLSDRHRYGRSALLVTFESGLALMYKPKPPDLERAWFDLIRWLNENGCPLPFVALTVDGGAAHSWVEVVRAEPCRSTEDVERYYRRSGMLTCLVYMLDGIDCHFENLIAKGDQPVLVDLETIMQPRVRVGQDSDPLAVAVHDAIENTVLRSGLLPRWVRGKDSRAVDVSALGAVDEQTSLGTLPRWRRVNSDNMRVDVEPGRITPGASAPTLNGQPLSPNDHAEALESGFREMYRFLMERRTQLLAADGPLTRLRHGRVRFILRGTSTYQAVMTNARQTRYARDGADWSIQLDVTTRSLLAPAERPDWWLAVVDAERRAMTRGDVPVFEAQVDDEALITEDGRRVPGFFRESMWERLVQRLTGLDATDAERQIGFMRAALHARVATGVHEVGRPEPPPPRPRDVALLEPQRYIAESRRIAEQLRRDAIGNPGSAVTWITLRRSPELGRYQVEPIGPELYGGAVGVGLFLAAHYRIDGVRWARDLALAAVHPVCQELSDEGPERFAEQFGLGGGDGLGSIVYGLTRTGELLGEEDLLASAAQAASLTAQRIQEDRKYDLLAGSAGLLLGLLALHRAANDHRALDLAIACGDHLIRSRRPSLWDLRSWVTLSGRMCSGMAHGAAGIAHALIELFRTVNDRRYYDAAQEAIEYERALYSPVEGNWRDLRDAPGDSLPDRFGMSWCHGAPGIALSRVAMGTLSGSLAADEIDAALRTTQKYSVRGVDHLCCGSMGRAAILLECGQRLGSTGLLEAAHQRAAMVVERRQERGHYTFFWDLDGEISIPGLLQGSSGIGYSLLQFAAPDRIPCVLLMV